MHISMYARHSCMTLLCVSIFICVCVPHRRVPLGRAYFCHESTSQFLPLLSPVCVCVRLCVRVFV